MFQIETVGPNEWISWRSDHDRRMSCIMLAFEWSSLWENKELLVWLSLFSAVTFVGSLLLIPVLCVRMGEDYFMPHRDHQRTMAGRHPVLRWTGLVLKNGLGLLLVLAGIAMIVLPGQGLLTILIGIMMLDFPGKRALELKLIRFPGLLRAINHLRHRAGHGPLLLPDIPVTKHKKVERSKRRR